MKRLTLAILFLGAAAMACGCGDASAGEGGPREPVGPAKEDIWRFAIEETTGSVQHRYALKFKELIEKRLDGVRVIVYPYGTLGTSDQVTELLRMGTVKFAMASPGHLGSLIPEVQALLLHFVFSNDQRVNHEALQSEELLETLDGLYGEKGLKLLSVYQEGWMVWTGNKAIRRPSDFAGVKIRVMTSPVLLAAYRAYGASPTPLSYGEVYSALQLNMIDAQVNPVFAIEEMSFYEVSDYMIFGRHAPFITTAVTQRRFFENLPDRRRAVVRRTIGELHDYIFDVQRKFNDERLETIKKNQPSLKIIEGLSDESRRAFREASMPVRDQYRRMAPQGDKVLRLLLEAIEETENRARLGGTEEATK